MNKVIVTGYKTYSFTNDNGQVVEGVKVSYLSSQKVIGQNKNGYLPMESTLNLKALGDFQEIPGVYEVNYQMIPGKGNKPTVEVGGFKFIKPADFGSLFK